MSAPEPHLDPDPTLGEIWIRIRPLEKSGSESDPWGNQDPNTTFREIWIRLLEKSGYDPWRNQDPDQTL